MIDPADIPRLKELGVIASLQPVAGVGVPWNPHEPSVSRIGEAKLPYAYAWQTLREAGAAIPPPADAASCADRRRGSDHPVARGAGGEGLDVADELVGQGDGGKAEDQGGS
mgnify:CR=1 FL=1